MKITGGTPAQKRIVLTIAAGGTVIGSIVLGRAACTPTQPPDVPPVVVVDAAADARDVAEPKCEFVSPRARGVRRKIGRIVGGKPAAAGVFPFTVAVATPSRQHYCGASVIKDTWVVSAAHCMIEAGDLVLVGSNSLTAARAVRITESRIHPAYDPSSLDNDVAVARLEGSAGVPSIPLASGVTSNDAIAVGWGKTCETCPTTNFLQEVALPLVDSADCIKSYPDLTEHQLCAGKKGFDACGGDSGSGLLTWSIDHWELLGITSYGVGCGRVGFPGVFTDVRRPDTTQWIRACSTD